MDEILQLCIFTELYFTVLNAILTFTGYYEDTISNL